MRKILLLIPLVLLSSCFDINEEDPIVESNKIDPNNPMIKMILASGFGIEDIESINNKYIVQGDILFTNEHLETYKQISLNQKVDQVQYQYLVDEEHRWMKIYLQPDDFVHLNPNILNDVLTEAIIAWNSVGSDISLSKANSAGEADIIISSSYYEEFSLCALASFPLVSGEPGPSIHFNDWTFETRPLNFSQLVLLTAHEIGHCLGFGHTNLPNLVPDFETFGFYVVDGTPTTDNLSIMNAGICGVSFSGLSEFDKLALLALYPSNDEIYLWNFDGNDDERIGNPSDLSSSTSITPNNSLELSNKRVRSGDFTYILNGNEIFISGYVLVRWRKDSDGDVERTRAVVRLIAQGDNIIYENRIGGRSGGEERNNTEWVYFEDVVTSSYVGEFFLELEEEEGDRDAHFDNITIRINR
ncbi:MAG: M57 family metalloprotease [Bacteroidota bacterium]